MINKIQLPAGYKPNNFEEYMNPYHLEYFRNKLLSWKNELLSNSQNALNFLQAENWHEADFNDRAAIELGAAFELRTQDRYRKLLEKIDVALEKIEKEEYGFCEETGEAIGLNRLEVRPIATFSIEAQERHENFERQHKDDE